MSLFYSASWQLIIRVLTNLLLWEKGGAGALQVAFRKSSQPASPVLSMHHHACKQQLRSANCVPNRSPNSDCPHAFRPPTFSPPSLCSGSGRPITRPFPFEDRPLGLARPLPLSSSCNHDALDAWSVKQSTRPPLAPLTCPPPSPRSIPPRPCHSHPISPLHSLSLLRSRRAHTLIHIQPAP